MQNPERPFCTFIKSLVANTHQKITGGFVAAMVVIFSLLHGVFPVWLVWALVSLAFFYAALLSWMEQRKITVETQVKLQVKLQGKLEKMKSEMDVFKNAETHENIMTKLAEFMTEAVPLQDTLASLLKKRDNVDFSQLYSDAREWADRVRPYLKEHVKKMSVFDFDHGHYDHTGQTPHHTVGGEDREGGGEAVNWKKQYPTDQGWIKMVPTMSSKAALGEIEIKNIATHGEPQLYDFGLIKQYGSRLTVICNGIMDLTNPR